MKKNINYFIWLIFIISYPAWSLISEQLSSYVKANYNSTGMIISSDYKSYLNVQSNIIKICGYQESSESATILKNDILKQRINASYESVNILFALIPREYSYRENLKVTDPMLRMNVHLNNSEFKQLKKKSVDNPSAKEVIDEQAQNDKINTEQSKKAATLLEPFNNYLIAQNLAEYFDKAKILQISKSLVGSYGLFMPQNISLLDRFNGYGRVLSSAVSVIDDLLLTTNDFNILNQSYITNNQLTEAQFLIFKAMEQAKTVVFIAECIAPKDTGDIRLPIALINNVSLDAHAGQINVNLLFCNNAINNFTGFYDFINARNSLLKGDTLTENWEFINCTFKLTINDDNPIQYKFSSAQIESNGCINKQENNLLMLNEDFLISLLSTYNYNNDVINTKLYELITNTNLDTKAKQKELMQDILKYENDNIKYPCEHYQRKCTVQFDCGCDKFWCCHKCHNQKLEQTACKSNKMQALNIQKIKCLICTYEQDFNAETSHSCTRCQTKFAEYYCSICKHFAGTNSALYHCEKCGICWVHGDRFFHCDICGICLDTKLIGNHKCQAESTHDECCICLEDSSPYYIILPCSHRMHKKCEMKAIMNGITNCSICRESFAHIHK